MSNVQAPVEQKTGLSPIAWVAIGCSSVLLVGVLIAFVVGGFVLNKMRQITADIETAPVVTTAKLIAAANPEIELVEADENSRVVIFRNTRTGEEFTFDFEDIEEGVIHFSSGDESLSIELDPGGNDDGTLTITTQDGRTFIGGGATADEIPQWVPVYPGTSPQKTISSDYYAGHWGAYTFTVEDKLQEVVDFYITEVKKLGLEITSQTTTPKSAMLIAQTPDEAMLITLTASEDNGKVQVLIQYNEN
jgi:hypothetical protein